jgi:hypothetical protein
MGRVFIARPRFGRVCVLYWFIGESDRIVLGHSSSTDLEPIGLRSGTDGDLNRG